MAAALGLRGKSLLALLLACLLVTVPAGLIGWQVLDGIHNHFGAAFARNTTLLSREKVFAPVSRELALAVRLANSVVTRQWLLDENDPQKRALFFREASGYQEAFADHAYFVASVASRAYYLNDGKLPYSEQARFVFDPREPGHQWFFGTVQSEAPYNLNVDHNVETRDIKIWFNVMVREAGKTLGVVGSGINLSSFLEDFVAGHEVGVNSIIVNDEGALQVYSDESRVALNSGALRKADDATSIFALVQGDGDADRVRTAMAQAVADPGSAQTTWATLDGRRQMVALSYIPELHWHIVTTVDLSTAQVLDAGWLTPLLLVAGVLLLALLIAFALAVERLVLKPLRALKGSAQAMAAGQYDVVPPVGGNDELGELGAAFSAMAEKIRSHTHELESRVHERTRALEQANLEMAAAHKKIDDSIDYASLIQHAILPSRQLTTAMGERHAVLWRPRDVVGGDFYVFREEAGGYLFGVVDCAGHGVPGALMTMLAHAALDQAISDVGIADPAAILARTDRIVRAMLKADPAQQALATNMDVGLAYVDEAASELLFSGAKVALHVSDGGDVEVIAGARRAVGDKRVGEYGNTRLTNVRGRTFYLTTDGFLDQAGGDKGFGFGNRRFTDMIQQHARLPLHEQEAAFSSTLAGYQGDYAQRDDITMLCFRID